MNVRTIILCIVGMSALLCAQGKRIAVSVNAPEPYLEPEIVNTTTAKYTHQNLLEDIDSLVGRYPDVIYKLPGDTTMQGRHIPVLYLGSPDAQHSVMVQASMHAREYINVQLVMAMAEQYAKGLKKQAQYQGIPFDTLFSKVAFVIMPSVNPDGIAIAQNGASGGLTEDVRQWVNQNTRAGHYYHTIKSNANGVDINRNFSNGFGKGSTKAKEKSYYYYGGPQPYSEPESRLMLAVSALYPYSLFLNYHSQGNLVYYGCGNALKSVNKKAEKLAKLIKSHTNYPIYGPDSANPNGSWADEVEVLYQKPSATIETGDTTPVPIKQFPSIFRKNKWVWAEVAKQIINGEF